MFPRKQELHSAGSALPLSYIEWIAGESDDYIKKVFSVLGDDDYSIY